MNEKETDQLYQIIFGGDRSQGWQSWQGNAIAQGYSQPCWPGKMGKKKATCWKGGVTMTRCYRMIWIPIHPRATKLGYVLEHVLVCEMAIGKFLPKGALPHHVNESKSDNRNANLVVCHDRAYHNLIHKRMRALRECGHADWHRCKFCHKWEDPEKLYVMEQKGETAAYHRDCIQEYKASKSAIRGRVYLRRGPRGPYKHGAC